MYSSIPENLTDRLYTEGVLACMTLDDPLTAVPAARALVSGGISAMELTLRTPSALESLRRIVGEVPEMLAGVGTILRPEQVREVVEAGGRLGVAPGLSERVVKAAQDAGLPFMPGITTPSELEHALELGCRELKFFPAEPSGGITYMKSMATPYKHLGVRFIPLGGLNLRNMSSYLEEPCTLAIGGSWIVTPEILKTENWTALKNIAREVSAVVSNLRRNTMLCVG